MQPFSTLTGSDGRPSEPQLATSAASTNTLSGSAIRPSVCCLTASTGPSVLRAVYAIWLCNPTQRRKQPRLAVTVRNWKFSFSCALLRPSEPSRWTELQQDAEPSELLRISDSATAFLVRLPHRIEQRGWQACPATLDLCINDKASRGFVQLLRGFTQSLRWLDRHDNIGDDSDDNMRQPAAAFDFLDDFKCEVP